MQIIAHRGASGIAPESTRAAIREAIRAHAQMVELDVQMTADGRLVVFHDDRLECTTNGSGRLSDTPYARLKSLDAGSWFDARFAGERILLLSQVFELMPRWMRLNLELKRTTHPRLLLDRLVRLIRHAGISRRVLLSSFDASLIEPLKRSGLARALICRRHPQRSLRDAIRLGCVSWHPHVSVLTRSRLATAHAAGVRVNVWTVNTLRQAKRLGAWGVDGMFTNHPQRFQGLPR